MRDTLIEFMDSLRNYVAESGTNIAHDERDSSEFVDIFLNQGQLLPIDSVSISLPDYEYEMLIDDEGTPFEINSWIPIATDRIKDPSRIDEYIAKGLLRKRQ